MKQRFFSPERQNVFAQGILKFQFSTNTYLVIVRYLVIYDGFIGFLKVHLNSASYIKLHIHMEACKGIPLASEIQTYDHRRKTPLWNNKAQVHVECQT